jgi:hypothetical protein
MDDIWRSIVATVSERIGGPMKFRLIWQPLMASIFAIRSGLEDAKAGKPPYLWSLFSDPSQRADLIRDGWKSVGIVFGLAIVLDVVHQFIVGRAVQAAEVIVVAFTLAILPYIVLRGLVTRFASRKND